MKRVEQSRHVPISGQKTPFAQWKRIDVVQEALPDKDIGRAAEAGGTITMEEWGEEMMKGNG